MKYICRTKLSGDIGAFIILEADRLTGPYTIIRDRYRPFDMEVGDFDIITSKEDGKAYLFEDGNYDGIYGIRLSDDYSSAMEIVSRQYTGLYAPFCREGVTVFFEENQYCMLIRWYDEWRIDLYEKGCR